MGISSYCTSAALSLPLCPFVVSPTLSFSDLFPFMRIQQKLSARSRYRSEILVLGILSPDRYREQFVEQSMTFLPRMAWAGLRFGVCPAPLRTQLRPRETCSHGIASSHHCWLSTHQPCILCGISTLSSCSCCCYFKLVTLGPESWARKMECLF